jgi:Undecaprenyl-phosphate glucose phosphotransferase
VIKRNQQFFNVANMLLDATLVAGSFVLVLGSLDARATALGAGAYAALTWLALGLGGFYNTDRFYRLRQKVRSLAAAVLVASILVVLMLYAVTIPLNPILHLETAALAFALLVAKYTCMRLLMETLRSHGYNIKHVVVVGTGEVALRYAKDIQEQPRLGYNVWGFVGNESSALPKPLLCGYDGLDDLLHDTEADEAVIALQPDEQNHLPSCIMCCENNGVRYSLVAREESVPAGSYDVNVAGSTRLLVPKRGRLDFVGWAFCKRLFDIVVSAAGIVLLSPLLLLLAVGVRLSGPGPILFRQERVGYNRKTFTMLKFRSMRPSGEESTAWTREDDPRRTDFGVFIRKFSLDELPQLFNVLAGSMSLVGPRPELPHFVEQYRLTVPGYMLKHYVRPGMTGWAQVNGLRGDTSIEERIACDLWYIEHWSPWLDLRILLRTLAGGMVNHEQVVLGHEAALAARSHADAQTSDEK